MISRNPLKLGQLEDKIALREEENTFTEDNEFIKPLKVANPIDNGDAVNKRWSDDRYAVADHSHADKYLPLDGGKLESSSAHILELSRSGPQNQVSLKFSTGSQEMFFGLGSDGKLRFKEDNNISNGGDTVASESWVTSNYVKKSGGNLTGTLAHTQAISATLPLIEKERSNATGIAIIRGKASGYDKGIGIATSGDLVFGDWSQSGSLSSNWNKVWHDGNLTKLSQLENDLPSQLQTINLDSSALYRVRLSGNDSSVDLTHLKVEPITNPNNKPEFNRNYLLGWRDVFQSPSVGIRTIRASTASVSFGMDFGFNHPDKKYKIRYLDNAGWHPTENVALESWVNSQGFLKTAQATLSDSTTNIILDGEVRRTALTGDVTSPVNSNALTIKSALVPSRNKLLSSENLNTITAPGFYRQNQTVNATLARNYPSTKAGSLQVYQANAIMQIYRSHDTGHTWRRDNYASTWSAWVRTDVGYLTAGTNVAISSTGVISATNTNTTYGTGTLAQLNTGTDTVGRVWGAETLADYVKEFDLGFPGTDKDMLFGDGTMRKWIGNVNNDDSIALGKQSTATGVYSAAFRGAATGNYSYAFGGGALGIHSIAIGNASGARSPYGIAIGSNSEVEVNNNVTLNGGIAIGGSAKSGGINSIALGRGAVALPHNYMKIGGDTPSDRIEHIEFTGHILEFGRDDIASRFYMYSADGKKWQVGITTNGTWSIARVGVIG